MKVTVVVFFLILTQSYGASKYSLDCKRNLLEKSREIAVEQVGSTEEGENRGKIIERYLASAGLKAGLPYCAAGQYWCFAEACRILRISANLIPVPATGLANVMFDYAKKQGRGVRYHPERDDLIVWRKGKSVFGHIERVVATGRAGWVYTIGFNTVKYVNGKRREGVFIHRRNIFSFLGRMHVRGIIGFNGVDSNDT